MPRPAPVTIATLPSSLSAADSALVISDDMLGSDSVQTVQGGDVTAATIDTWRGVYPAICTPFTAEDAIDLEAQRRVVRFALDVRRHTGSSPSGSPARC